MPTYTITHTVTLNEDVVMNINATNESAAIDQASLYIDSIVLDPQFINDNIDIELSFVEEDQPSYVPLVSSNPILETPIQNSSYTPISSLYNTASSTSNSSYTRLT